MALNIRPTGPSNVHRQLCRFKALTGPYRPGEILADELEELGISATALSRALDVPTNRITQIINGQRAITAETALRLSQWFGTSAEFWLNLQKQYELRLAEQQQGHKIRATVSRRVAHHPLASLASA
jgi:addiction module HigA family antidote